ncbi:MAG TPA: MBL fold metallo-hydrolase [Nannocystaceae bacterium]|nr:MBL fold metallo-hydrolase [Nannocystaceae bacterium]
MQVVFWGTRGSIPVSGPKYAEFGGNTPCLQIRLESTTDSVIIDSGSGIRELGLQLVRSADLHSRSIHLFLTHAHWDHIQGFPFFVPAYVPTFKLDIYCTKDARQILENQMRTPFFPVGLDAMHAKRGFHHLGAGEVVTIGEATVRHVPLPHPQESTAFRIDERGHSIVFATDTEHSPGHLNESLAELARGADILIYDAQYTSEEYKAGKQGWGHSTFGEAIKLANAAGVRRLVLYSHDPGHDDAMLRAIETAAARDLPGTISARDGLILDPATT